MNREIYTCKNTQELVESAGSLIVSLAEHEISKKGIFTLVLSGGKTPERLYNILAEPVYSDVINPAQ